MDTQGLMVCILGITTPFSMYSYCQKHQNEMSSRFERDINFSNLFLNNLIGPLLHCYICNTTTFHISLTEPPSANVTPSSVTVNEGEMVRIFCEAGGSGVLNVSWTMADGSPLPVGVQENGNEILIARASSLHPGTYVCSVRNLAGTSRDDADVTVFCKYPTVI